MTQPSTVNKSFDTSLVDVQRSFSSTDTNTSGSSAKENVQSSDKPRNASPYNTVPTEQLYEQWASTYDTDGNVLQAVDDVQLHQLLPKFVRLTCSTSRSGRNAGAPLKILDLGCGTGRNTLKLLQSSWNTDVDVFGWDSSRAMLEIAQSKYEAVRSSRSPQPTLKLEFQDIASLDSVPEKYNGFFAGLISTLVLEHIPLEAFTGILARVLKPGGYALITNMHQDMGALSRAGFKTASGERFKATSYIYTPQETVLAAEAAGFEIIDDVAEVAVDNSLIDGGVLNGVVVEKGMVAERARKWMGTKVWYGMILRKR